MSLSTADLLYPFVSKSKLAPDCFSRAVSIIFWACACFSSKLAMTSWLNHCTSSLSSCSAKIVLKLASSNLIGVILSLLDIAWRNFLPNSFKLFAPSLRPLSKTELKSLWISFALAWLVGFAQAGNSSALNIRRSLFNF